MRILDATAGMRGIWYQKNNPFTVFIDKRNTKEYRKDILNPAVHTQRVMRIFPDIQANWISLPFKNECFDMVVFDPPHMFKEFGKKEPSMAKMYGIFYKHNWKSILSKGASELFRTLKQDGIFIMKWCENDIKVDEVLKLLPYSPMFGTRTGQANKTHWICFIKSKQNRELSEFE